MNNRHPSDSTEQQRAEEIILQALNNKLKIHLKKFKSLNLGNVNIQPDAYSTDPPTICEIYAHIGKMNPAQQNKVQNDILKMLLADKKLKTTHRKIVAVCDSQVFQQLHNNSWKSETIKEFGIEVELVDIPYVVRKQIIAAQKRQFR